MCQTGDCWINSNEGSLDVTPSGLQTLPLRSCPYEDYTLRANMATEPSAPNSSGAREGQQLIYILNTISTDSIQDEGERCQALLAAYALVL